MHLKNHIHEAHFQNGDITQEKKSKTPYPRKIEK